MGASSVKGQMIRPVSRFLNSPAPQTIAISATAAASTQLNANEILIQSTVDCFFKVGTSAELTATPVTTATGHRFPAGVAWPVLVDPEHVIQVITSSSTGSFYVSAIS